MKRICIIGCSGSGKSRLAGHIATLLDLPAFSLDQYYWHSGWTMPAADDWRQRHEELIQQPKWILDGTYFQLLEERLAIADLVIFLDLPRRVCVFRIIWRTLRWWRRSRSGAPVGCVERFDWEFFHYVWTFRRDYHPNVVERLNRRPATCRLITIKNSQDISTLMTELAASLSNSD